MKHIPFNKKHWDVFKSIPFKEQGAVGDIPLDWIKRHGIQEVPNSIKLPNKQLSRTEVREICLNKKNPVLFGYVCAMAWGVQGRGPNGSKPVQKAWENREKIALSLEKIRSGGLTSSESYDLFTGSNASLYLGPSYFTKLIYFFRPEKETQAYIMDQWTAKSVNLLTGRKVVKIHNSSPLKSNSGKNYKDFCAEIDRMALLMGTKGDKVEQMLFSKGYRPPEPWRKYVKENL
jgi:hypothetical protein